MRRVNFTDYDIKPEGMVAYMQNYGPHFNKKMCDFAVSKMESKVNGVKRKIQPYTKEDVDNILSSYGVAVNNGQLYDHVYVANMCKADFLNSSVIDERHLALYVKDVIDDVDAPDGLLFNRWYADTCYCGIAIDWDEMI